MLIMRKKGLLKLQATAYSLAFAKDRPFVYLADAEGTELAELFVLSSVHPLNGRDDTTAIGTWQIVESRDEVILSLDVESSVWQRKTYRFRCTAERLQYEVEVEGSGALAEANSFGGYYSGQVRWGSGFFWSGQLFRQGFNPEPNRDEVNHFLPVGSAAIDLMGVPLPGKAGWFFTPAPFCFAFEGTNGWVGIGVEARPGAKRFTEFCYNGRIGGFYLSLAFEGHTRVDGRYRLPSIGFDFGKDELTVLAAHVQAQGHEVKSLHTTGKPAWWYEPIFCGWGAQCYLAEIGHGLAPDYSRQEFYQEFINVLTANGVHPGMLTIDDKWQSTYGHNRVDEAKWPDLPGFIRGQHAAGRKVILWLKLWDCEGLPADECIRNARRLALSVDPSNPKYQKRLREQVHQMLNPGGYDCDGFKIDFSARIPSGPGISTFGDVWGLELMKIYLGIIYDEAKKCKRDALVITHTPHPYLADVVDMIRLNDINKDKDVPSQMKHRARVARIACPDALIDTDNWPIKDRASWRDYTHLQPELGVPSLYYATHIDTTREALTAEDYALIREVWAKYRAERPSGIQAATRAGDAGTGKPSERMIEKRTPKVSPGAGGFLTPLGSGITELG